MGITTAHGWGQRVILEFWTCRVTSWLSGLWRRSYRSTRCIFMEQSDRFTSAMDRSIRVIFGHLWSKVLRLKKESKL